MLKKLSLQARLILFISTLLCLALFCSAVTVMLFSPVQLADEHEASVRLTSQLAKTLNQSLQRHGDPGDLVAALTEGLPTFVPGRLGFLPAGTVVDTAQMVSRTAAGVPSWFSHFLTDDISVERFPLKVGDQYLGDIVFSPDLSADIREKWLTFLAVIASGLLLVFLNSVIAYVTVRRTLHPLRDLEDSLTRLQSGHYGIRIDCDGPPEIARSLHELNTLSETLKGLSADNRSLMRKVVTLQDEERRELSRELHDELGPQLFAIRANAAALDADGTSQPDAGVQRLIQAVETLQETNRRILDRLRPMHIQELGLIRSLNGLVHNAQAQAGATSFESSFDPSLDELDPLTTQTIYRVTQESLTNVLRHADASRVKVSVRMTGPDVKIEVSDNGRGIPEAVTAGRGITGMRERVRALGGAFEFGRRQNLTFIEASIPMEFQPKAEH